MAKCPEYFKVTVNGLAVELQPIYEEMSPVRHGRWEVYLGGKELMCSSCKTTFWDEEENGGSNYCPNCGAKMDGDADG